jgi:hypothetical protein
VTYGVIAGIATLYGVVLARRFKAPEIVEGQRVSSALAVVVAIVFGAVLASAYGRRRSRPLLVPPQPRCRPASGRSRPPV